MRVLKIDVGASDADDLWDRIFARVKAAKPKPDCVEFDAQAWEWMTRTAYDSIRSWRVAVSQALYLEHGIGSMRRSYSALEVASALTHINHRRARVCVQPPLDPDKSGWTDDDIVTEAIALGWKDPRRARR